MQAMSWSRSGVTQIDVVLFCNSSASCSSLVRAVAVAAAVDQRGMSQPRDGVVADAPVAAAKLQTSAA